MKPARAHEQASRLTVTAPEDRARQAKALYESGLILEDVASELGVSSGTARSDVIRAGGQLRSRGSRKTRIERALERTRAAAHADFATFLRAARADLGWSQERLAREVGVQQTFISQLELGQAKARPGTVERIISALATSEDREARRLYESGLTLDEVGEALGFSAETAKRRVLAAGGQVRPLAGRTLPLETRLKMSASRRGKRRPADVVTKISSALRVYYADPERLYRARLASAKGRARRCTPEAGKKMVARAARRLGGLSGGRPEGKLSYWNLDAVERIEAARARLLARGEKPTVRALEAETGGDGKPPIPRSTIARLLSQ